MCNLLLLFVLVLLLIDTRKETFVTKGAQKSAWTGHKPPRLMCPPTLLRTQSKPFAFARLEKKR